LRHFKTAPEPNGLDSLDWISAVLNLPPERRAAHMDIIWVEQDADALMVLAVDGVPRVIPLQR
jgi:hypothetical protein